MNRVLIVEDEAGLRQGLADVITAMGLEPVAVTGLAEARQALARADRSGNAPRPPVDCLLLDIRLRDGDGLDFLRELRAGPARDVPVIVTTAYGDSERTIRAMRDGAFDYLTKPFDLPSLRAAVDRAVKQRALMPAAAPAAPPRRTRRCSSPARPAPARSWSRAPSTRTRRAPARPSSPSTARP